MLSGTRHILLYRTLASDCCYVTFEDWDQLNEEDELRLVNFHGASNPPLMLAQLIFTCLWSSSAAISRCMYLGAGWGLCRGRQKAQRGQREKGLDLSLQGLMCLPLCGGRKCIWLRQDVVIPPSARWFFSMLS